MIVITQGEEKMVLTCT